MIKMNSLENKVNDVIKFFKKEEYIYCIVSEFLNLLLQKCFPHAQSVEARTKSRSSIAGKVLTKFAHISDAAQIYQELTDLAGGRVIFLRQSEVDDAEQKIRNSFPVDDRNSQDTANRLNIKEFGYLSKHYIIAIDWHFLQRHDDILTKAAELYLCKYDCGQEDTASLKAKIENFFSSRSDKMIFAELQIRSCLQHVWAELEHDQIYKGNRNVPAELQRSWHALAAILEHADQGIEQVLSQLQRQRDNTPYYIAEELQNKIQKLEIITKIQLDDDSMPAEKKRKYLQQYKNELSALYRINSKPDPELLNEIDKAADLEKTQQETSELLKKDLTDPKLLLEYFRHSGEDSCNSAQKTENILTVINYIYGSGVCRCEEMIKTSSELPWAFAGKALFKLLLLEKHEEERTSENIYDIYDSILRLIDLCNARSIANLDKERLVATNDSYTALENLLSAVKKISWQFLNISADGQAPVLTNVEQLLELGIYAHPRQNAPIVLLESPQVIIAGGCGSLEKNQVLQDFKTYFDGYVANAGFNKITFCTGGGRSGICSLDFGSGKNEVIRFGIKSDKDDECDFKSPYSEHSLYEALMIWQHFKQKKYKFDQIALVGFGLGQISGFECRIALAFGARVTVIGHRSFLSNKQTFRGIPHWSDHPSLVSLPLIKGTSPKNRSIEKDSNVCKFVRTHGFPEPVMLRTFMLFMPFFAEAYSSNDEVVKLIHRIKQVLTSVKPKDETDPVKRCSAYHRKLFFLELYKDANGGTPAAPVLEGIPEEISDLKTLLKNLYNDLDNNTPIDYKFGEREHARWYIERWLQGTRYGDNKIDKNVPREQRTNPCMAAWFDLNDDIIKQDTDFLLRYKFAKAIEGYSQLLQAVNNIFL